MRKMPNSQRRRRSAGGAATAATGGVSIASGANVPRIDLEALFRDGAMQKAPAAPVTGGGVQQAGALQNAVPIGAPETVALADGTRITFASADWSRVLETA